MGREAGILITRSTLRWGKPNARTLWFRQAPLGKTQCFLPQAVPLKTRNAIFKNKEAQNPTRVGDKFVMKHSSKRKNIKKNNNVEAVWTSIGKTGLFAMISLQNVTMRSAMEHEYPDVHFFLLEACWLITAEGDFLLEDNHFESSNTSKWAMVSPIESLLARIHQAKNARFLRLLLCLGGSSMWKPSGGNLNAQRANRTIQKGINSKFLDSGDDQTARLVRRLSTTCHLHGDDEPVGGRRHAAQEGRRAYPVISRTP